MLDDSSTPNDASQNGSLGGKRRAEKLSSEERRAIAIRAAQARWQMPESLQGKPLPRAIATGVLPVGGIPCAVLDDIGNTRVLTQEGFLEAIGRAAKAKAGQGATAVDGMPAFLRAGNLKPFINNDLEQSTKPIVFQPFLPGGFRGVAFGYRAQVLPQVCWVYHEAMLAGKLLPSQKHIAEACTNLLKALTNVAIDALVDEATGFQDVRAKNALIKLLEKYISKDALPWVKTFDDEFYKEMFRLHGYPYDPSSVKRPMIFARRTEDIYNRLAPGARQELQRLVKRGSSGRPKEKLFQYLNDNHGYLALKELIRDAKIVMKLSSTPEDYLRKLDKIHPRFGDTLLLPYDELDA